MGAIPTCQVCSFCSSLRYLTNSLFSNGKLICYYSDQRDNATHGQTMVHQVTNDLKNWGPVVEDVAYPTYTDRPGMPVVTKVSYTEDTPVPCLENANVSSSRTVNTSTSMNMVPSLVPKPTPSLCTTVCRPTPRISPPPRDSVWLSPVVLSQHPRRTLCGHHMGAKTALLSSAPVHRVLCSSTKLSAKESGQRSPVLKDTATHGLYGCCRRREVDTWL